MAMGVCDRNISVALIFPDSLDIWIGSFCKKKKKKRTQMRRTAPSLACYKTSPPPKKRVSKISSETKGWLDRDRQPLKKKLHIIPKSLLQPGSSLTLVLNFVRPPLLPGAIPVQVLLVGKAGLIQGAFRGDANAFRVLLDTIHPPFLGSATGSPAILGKPHCVSCV